MTRPRGLMQPVGSGWRVSSRRSKRPLSAVLALAEAWGGLTLAYSCRLADELLDHRKSVSVGIV